VHLAAAFKENFLDAIAAYGDKVIGSARTIIVRRQGSVAGGIGNGKRSAESRKETAADIMLEGIDP
jgi:hypothetical protein